MQIQANQQKDVIVVGGGMVGLSLSLMLAKHGIAVTLLEAVRYPQDSQHALYQSSFDARNTALSRRTVQIYRQMGVWDTLQQHATPIHHVHITEQHGFGRAQLHHEDEGVESFGQVIENAWLGRVLLQAVRQQPLITLIDHVKVTALYQNQYSATLIAQQDHAQLSFSAHVVIAADGRDSFCRQALGVGVERFDYQQVALVTTVQTSKPHQHVAYERFSPNGPLALLPLPGEYRRSVVWTVKAGDEQQWLGAAHDSVFLQALQQCYGNRAGKFVKTAARLSYPLAQILARQQVVGRVVLMGNAAHTLHPVAGQGFNLCMRDADVLVAYLSHQHIHQLDLGEHGMLKRYEAARLPDQRRVIQFCDSVVRGFSNQQQGLKLLRNGGLLAFDLLPGIKPLVANFAMGLKA